MQFKKITAGFLAVAMAVTSLSEAVFAAPTAAETVTSVQPDITESSSEQEAVYESPDQYHAYIGFQTSDFSQRTEWDNSDFGMESGFFDKVVVPGNYGPDTYPQYADKFSDDFSVYFLDAAYKDAVIDKSGTYTISVSDFDWTLENENGFNLIYFSTDIPASSPTEISDVKLFIDGKEVINAPGVVPYEDDVESDAKVKSAYSFSDDWYKTVYLVNIYNPLLEGLPSDEYPANELAIEFTVNIKDGFDYSDLDDGTIEITRYTGSATEVEIPSSIDGKKVTSIGDRAFRNRENITSVKFPDTLTNIGMYSFENCTSLTEIKIPDGVTHIGYQAFYDCTNLASVTIPDTVTRMDGYVFFGTAFLKNQTGTVKYAGQWAVSYDGVTPNVTIKSGTIGIADCTFLLADSLISITLPDTMKYITRGDYSDCPNLATIIIDENNKDYVSKDDAVFNKDMTEILFCLKSKEGDFVIPDSVTSINDEAFLSCSNLTSVKIPNSVTSIGDHAFAHCSSLKSITIPDSVTSIKTSAFYYCTGFTSINIPDSVTMLGDNAFEYCTNLTSIIIPVGITSIKESTFSGCSSLKDVYYNGSKEQWDKIDIDNSYEGNSNLLNATIHYNNGKVTAPSSVTGLKLKGRAGDALRISWTKNTSADGYIIEMKDGSKWSRVGKITSNSTVEFKKSKLKAGTAYTFRVKAYKMSGKTALYSGYTSISARTNPSAVTGLKLKGRSGDALRISWTKNTSADGYIIEMKVNGTWTRVGKVTKNSTVEFRKAGLKAGTAYSFRVKSYKMSGKTALYSATKTISVRTNPSAVSGLKLKNANSNAVRLAWSKNTSADGYIIEMKVNGTWTRVGKVTKNSTVEFRKGSLKGKTSYTFRVKAYKMSGKTALYSGYTTITVKTK